MKKGNLFSIHKATRISAVCAILIFGIEAMGAASKPVNCSNGKCNEVAANQTGWYVPKNSDFSNDKLEITGSNTNINETSLHIYEGAKLFAIHVKPFSYLTAKVNDGNIRFYGDNTLSTFQNDGQINLIEFKNDGNITNPIKIISFLNTLQGQSTNEIKRINGAEVLHVQIFKNEQGTRINELGIFKIDDQLDKDPYMQRQSGLFNEGFIGTMTIGESINKIDNSGEIGGIYTLKGKQTPSTIETFTNSGKLYGTVNAKITTFTNDGDVQAIFENEITTFTNKKTITTLAFNNTIENFKNTGSADIKKLITSGEIKNFLNDSSGTLENVINNGTIGKLDNQGTGSFKLTNNKTINGDIVDNQSSFFHFVQGENADEITQAITLNSKKSHIRNRGNISGTITLGGENARIINSGMLTSVMNLNATQYLKISNKNAKGIITQAITSNAKTNVVKNQGEIREIITLGGDTNTIKNSGIIAKEITITKGIANLNNQGGEIQGKITANGETVLDNTQGIITKGISVANAQASLFIDNQDGEIQGDIESSGGGIIKQPTTFANPQNNNLSMFINNSGAKATTQAIKYSGSGDTKIINSDGAKITGAVELSGKNAVIFNENASLQEAITISANNAEIKNTKTATIQKGITYTGGAKLSIHNEATIEGGIQNKGKDLELINAKDAVFALNTIDKYHLKHTGNGTSTIKGWNFHQNGKYQRIILDGDVSKVSVVGDLYGDFEIFKDGSYVQYLVLDKTHSNLSEEEINKMRMKDPNDGGTKDIAGNKINGGTNKFSDAFQGANPQAQLKNGSGGIFELKVHETGLIGTKIKEDAIIGDEIGAVSINSFNARLVSSQNTLREISIKNFKSQKEMNAKAYEIAQNQSDSYIAEGYEHTYDLYAQADTGELIYNEALRGYTDKDLLNALDSIFIKQDRGNDDVYSFAVPYFNLTRDGSGDKGNTISRSYGILLGAQKNSDFGTFGIYGNYESAKRENDATNTNISDASFMGGLTYYNAFYRYANKELFVNIGTSLGNTRTDLHTLDIEGTSGDTTFDTLNYGVDARFGFNIYDVLTNSMVTPEIGVVYTGLNTDSFGVQHRSGVESYEATTTNLFEGLVGIRYHKAGTQIARFSMATGAKFRIYDDAKTHMNFIGAIHQKIITNVALPDVFFYVQTGYSRLIGDNAEISFNYQANFAEAIQSHTGFIRFGYWW